MQSKSIYGNGHAPWTSLLASFCISLEVPYIISLLDGRGGRRGCDNGRGGGGRGGGSGAGVASLGAGVARLGAAVA